MLLLSGTRTRALLLLSAGVTVTMLLLQVAMVNVMTVAYAGPEAVVALEGEQMHQKRVRVFEPMLRAPPAALPVVLMHGMGDAAGNAGMKHIRDVRFVCISWYQ